MARNSFSIVGKTSFDRGDIFVSMKGDKKGSIYMLVRESRPINRYGQTQYVYNLLNLETGKMRFTEADKCFITSEPIPAAQMDDRFGLNLYHVGDISNTIPMVRAWAAGIVAESMKDDRPVDPREAVLALLKK